MIAYDFKVILEEHLGSDAQQTQEEHQTEQVG